MSSVKTVGFYMHHIYNAKKKRLIVQEAKKYDILGLYKFGKPGRVIIQSSNHTALKNYIKIIKSQTWQICTITATSEEIPSEASPFTKFVECKTDTEVKDRLFSVHMADFWFLFSGFKKN